VPPVAKVRRNAAAAPGAAPWPAAAAREQDGMPVQRAGQSQVQRVELLPRVRRLVSAAAPRRRYFLQSE